MNYQLFVVEISIIAMACVLVWQILLIVASISGLYLMSTNARAFEEILNKIKPEKGLQIVDLGCGNATNLIIASKKFSLRGVGIELFFTQYLIAKFNVWVSGQSKNIQIFIGDFRKRKDLIKKADIIYLYQRQELLETIENKIFQLTKSGAKIICLSSYFIKHKSVATFTVKNVYSNATVRVYKS